MAVMYALTDLTGLNEELLSDGLEFAFVDGPTEAQALDMTDEVFRAMAMEFPRGVAFGPGREIRWQKRRNGKIHVVVVSEDDLAAPEGAPRLDLTLAPDEEPKRLLLVGQRISGRHFQDGRIPGDLEFPDDSEANELAAEIRHYEAADGRRVWRCVRLRGAQ
jgi:hypothetical protein